MRRQKVQEKPKRATDKATRARERQKIWEKAKKYRRRQKGIGEGKKS